MFGLVFALSEGSTYGWWTPLKEFSVVGHGVWPASRPISIMPIVLAVSIGILVVFYFVERAKERRDAHPLFPFVHLRIKTYRYGLLVGLVLAMGQFGLSFVLPVFLQGARLLTPEQNGWWQFPTGVFIIVGAQIGGRLIRAVGTTIVVRLGLFSYVAGILLILHAVSLQITVWRLLPGLAFYGVGIGFAGAQLTNVVMSEVPAESSGVASGANTTVRQVGAALGVAMIGSLLSVQILSHSVSRIRATALPLAVKAQALAGVHAQGAFYKPPASTSPHDTSILQHALRTSVVGGTRFALLFAAVVVAVGALLSFLIPRVAGRPARTDRSPRAPRTARRRSGPGRRPDRRSDPLGLARAPAPRSGRNREKSTVRGGVPRQRSSRWQFARRPRGDSEGRGARPSFSGPRRAQGGSACRR